MQKPLVINHCLIFVVNEKFPQPDRLFSEDLNPLYKADYEGNGIEVHLRNLEGSYWINFEALNNTDDTVTAFFFFGRFLNSRMYMYELNSGLKYEIDLRSLFLKNEDFIFPVNFKPNTKYRLAVFLHGTNSANLKPVFFIAGAGKNSVTNLLFSQRNVSKEERFFNSYASLILQGFLLSMLIFSLIYFFISWQRVFIFYFLYILVTLLYFFHRDFEIEVTGLFWHRVAFLKDLTWQPLSYLLYFLFAIHFVDYRKLSPKLFQFIKWMIGFGGEWRVSGSVLLSYGIRSAVNKDLRFRNILPLASISCLMR